MTLALIILGSAMLFFGGDWLVQGAGFVAQRFGLSKLLIGLTVVAFGTSTPELAVSLYSSWHGLPDLAVGNVVGSNVINILLVLGLAAVISPIPVSKALFRFDLPVLMIVSILSYALCYDGSLDRLEGLLLFLSLLFYLWFAFQKGRAESSMEESAEPDELDELLEVASRQGMLFAMTKLIVGVLLLVIGSRLFIDSAVDIAHKLGVSELVIGMTMVALGTSLPEVATTVVAAFRGEKDIALGNIVGSNIFNLLGVLGLSAVVAPSDISINADAVRFEFPVMLSVTALCFPVFYWKYCVTRFRGVLFLGIYAIYVYWLFHR